MQRYTISINNDIRVMTNVCMCIYEVLSIQAYDDCDRLKMLAHH